MRQKLLIFLTLLILLTLSGCSSEMHIHKWTEANYQSPSTCSVCGATKGLPLTADFDKYNIAINLLPDEEAAYHTVCGEEQLETQGSVQLISCHNITEDETHQAKNGYSWQIVKVLLVMGDENSNTYGFDYNYIINDFYDIETFEKTFVYDEKSGYNRFTVNYNGKDYEDCLAMVTASSGEWKKDGDVYKKEIELTWNMQVPTGYDGMVIGLRNSKVSTDGKYYLYQYYTTDDFLLYKVGNDYEKTVD